MSLDGQYDPDNIFAKIVRGEAPAAKVFEDHDTLAFMDVFPQGRGHMMVIHKRARARNLFDIDPQDLHAVMLTVQRVALAARATLKPDGVYIAQFNGQVAGQTVFHLHFHVIPRWEGVPLGRHAGGGMADMAELKELAEQIALEIA
ncbi:MAG TPA: HIT family protein [Caulobacteraceae bacterium]|jgi:histidine triad (HIT) family protein